MPALLTSKFTWAVIVVALVLGAFGIQGARLAHAKTDLTAARASLAAANDRVKVSEALRASEYAKATSALSEAEKACSARVHAAIKSGAKIHALVTRPTVLGKDNCPVRQLLNAGELRDALQGR